MRAVMTVVLAVLVGAVVAGVSCGGCRRMPPYELESAKRWMGLAHIDGDVQCLVGGGCADNVSAMSECTVFPADGRPFRLICSTHRRGGCMLP